MCGIKEQPWETVDSTCCVQHACLFLNDSVSRHLPYGDSPHRPKAQSEVAQLCPALCDPVDCSLHLWGFPGKGTGVGCHFLLWGPSRLRDAQTT